MSAFKCSTCGTVRCVSLGCVLLQQLDSSVCAMAIDDPAVLDMSDIVRDWIEQIATAQHSICPRELLYRLHLARQ